MLKHMSTYIKCARIPHHTPSIDSSTVAIVMLEHTFYINFLNIWPHSILETLVFII